MDKLYIKFSLDDRQPRFGTEPMPEVGGTATEPRGAKLCEYGWHACLPGAAGRYIGTEAYLVRLSGSTDSDEQKAVGSTIETVARLPWTRADMVDFARAAAARASASADAAASSYAAAAAAAYAAAYAAAAARASAYAAAAAASAAYAAASYARAAEYRAQWQWIVDRLRENGADLTGVEGV